MPVVGGEGEKGEWKRRGNDSWVDPKARGKRQITEHRS